MRVGVKDALLEAVGEADGERISDSDIVVVVLCCWVSDNDPVVVWDVLFASDTVGLLDMEDDGEGDSETSGDFVGDELPEGVLDSEGGIVSLPDRLAVVDVDVEIDRAALLLGDIDEVKERDSVRDINPVWVAVIVRLVVGVVLLRLSETVLLSVKGYDIDSVCVVLVCGSRDGVCVIDKLVTGVVLRLPEGDEDSVRDND